MPGGGDACSVEWAEKTEYGSDVQPAFHITSHILTKKKKRNMDPTFNLHFISHHTSDEKKKTEYGSDVQPAFHITSNI